MRRNYFHVDKIIYILYTYYVDKKNGAKKNALIIIIIFNRH